MKFLCVPCDRPMVLSETKPPERGSIALVYACPDCGYEMAMLTNAHETQLVGSLGVRIGPAGESAASKCPFTGVVREMAGEGEPADRRDLPERAADPPHWTDEALARLAGLPEFVRPLVQSGIERFARDGGHAEIDGRVLDLARRSLGFGESQA